MSKPAFPGFSLPAGLAKRSQPLARWVVLGSPSPVMTEVQGCRRSVCSKHSIWKKTSDMGPPPKTYGKTKVFTKKTWFLGTKNIQKPCFWYLKTRFFGGENLCFSWLSGCPRQMFFVKPIFGALQGKGLLWIILISSF